MSSRRRGVGRRRSRLGAANDTMLLCLKLSNGSLLFDQGFSALRRHLGTNSLACIAYTRESTVADRQEVELRVANIQKLLKSQDGSSIAYFACAD
jgi:hypothetical protein